MVDRAHAARSVHQHRQGQLERLRRRPEAQRRLEQDGQQRQDRQDAHPQQGSHSGPAQVGVHGRVEHADGQHDHARQQRQPQAALELAVHGHPDGGGRDQAAGRQTHQHRHPAPAHLPADEQLVQPIGHHRQRDGLPQQRQQPRVLDAAELHGKPQHRLPI